MTLWGAGADAQESDKRRQVIKQQEREMARSKSDSQLPTDQNICPTCHVPAESKRQLKMHQEMRGHWNVSSSQPTDPAVPDELRHYHNNSCNVNTAYAPNTPRELIGTKECDCGLLALFTQYQHLQYNKDEKELQLCNCDGHWHVECPDGITRYISDESLQEYARQARLDEVKKLPKLPWKDHLHCIDTEYVDNRIAQLTATPHEGEETV